MNMRLLPEASINLAIQLRRPLNRMNFAKLIQHPRDGVAAKGAGFDERFQRKSALQRFHEVDIQRKMDRTHERLLHAACTSNTAHGIPQIIFAKPKIKMT